MVAGPDVSGMRPGDESEVDALLRAAFPGPEEAGLVRQLRADGAMASERVIRWQGRIGAYAGISRMVAPEGWFCLAPVAVLPEWQGGALGAGLHLGTQIVRQIAEIFIERPIRGVTERGLVPCLVVLGAPAFYARCGFSLERAARLTSPYPVDHTLIARPGQDVPEETLVYPKAFDGE
ncbi:MAG: N-acetyltransferase [Rhodobacterales bacterium]|nr:N-acetyltransferase [Rhodobacterales bacterium]